MLEEVKKETRKNQTATAPVKTEVKDEFLKETNLSIGDAPILVPSTIEPLDESVKDLHSHMMDSDFVEGVFAEAEGKSSRELKEVTAQYLDLNDFKHGEERTFICTGTTTFTTDQGEVKDAVVLMNRERANFICGSIVVVSACKRLSKMPAAIRLQVNGKVKGKNGSYFDVKVFEF